MAVAWLVRLLFFTLAHGGPLAGPLSRFYAKLLDLAVPKLRRSARRNFEITGFPGGNDKLIDGVFRSIARVLVAIAQVRKLNRSNIHDLVEYEGFEHYEEAKRRGRGALFATAHLGNWELSAVAHSLLTEPMHVVVRPLDNAAVDAVIEARREATGNHVISKRDAARDILRALKRNEPVGILIDQNVSPAEGVFIDFLGAKACAGTAFARLAAHSGAAVIPGFAFWSETKRKYVLRFYPLVPITGDAAEDTRRIHEVIEQAIREHPDQWLWLHRRWKTRPPGEPPLY
jgi:Kdo2-lipid IVA lauroyltransferase/acyltransferase